MGYLSKQKHLVTLKVDLPLNLFLEIFWLIHRLAVLGLFFRFLDPFEYFPCFEPYVIQLIIYLFSCRLTCVICGMVLTTVSHESETAEQSIVSLERLV